MVKTPWFPVDFPLNQSSEIIVFLLKPDPYRTGRKIFGESMENSPTAAQLGDPNHHHKGSRKALIDCWWLISLTKSTGVVFLIINQLIMIVLDDCWWLTTLTPTTGGLAAFFKLLCQRRTQASQRRILRPWAKPMLHPCSKARTMSFLSGEGKVSSEAGVDYLDIS